MTLQPRSGHRVDPQLQNLSGEKWDCTNILQTAVSCKWISGIEIFSVGWGVSSWELNDCNEAHRYNMAFAD